MSEDKKIINDNEEIKTESTTNEESVNNDVVIEEVAENNNGESEEIVQSEEVAEKGIKTKIKKFIATVGDTKITGEQLRQKMEPLFYINAKTKMTDEEIDANEASFIDYMTTTEVLYLEGKAEGIKVEKEDIENEYSTLMSSLQQTYNITEDELINKCNITKEDIEKIKSYYINPVDSREVAIDNIELSSKLAEPNDVEILHNFINKDRKEIE